MEIGVLSDLSEYTGLAGILVVIFMCLVFNKAGESWWKALIPIYDVYILFKICWDTSKFWIYVLLIVGLTVFIVASSFFMFMSINSNFIIALISAIVLLLTVISFISLFVMSIKVNVNLSSSFGHGVWFAIGLLLLPFIFLAILALDNSKYIGPQK